ncbi:MAG: DegT/DnrJ/EryC1/StrS family aminotransferase [Acidobacteriota bacterium]
MDLPFRYVAPAGAPFSVGDLVRWAGTAVSRPSVAEALVEAMRNRFGVRHVFLTSTGRAGLTLLLRALRRLEPARDEVAIPSYTCYSVPASIAKAGLRPRLIDISPDTLDFAPAALAEHDFSRTLAIVATNLYGLPSDLPGLQQLARAHGLFLVDDAAQAMGASVGGRWSGTWGDAGLYSFDKGKNVSAIDGGVVVTNSEDLAAAVRAEMSDATAAGATLSPAHVVKALAYFVMLRPWLYGIPARLPQLGLGRTEYTTEYPLSLPDPMLTALALTMLPKLEAFTATRQANAAAILDALSSIPGVDTIAVRRDATPAYLRLPILLADRHAQVGAIQALNAAGIGASGSYPQSLADVPELRQTATSPRAAGGRRVAHGIVTLPTHPFVSPADIRRMRSVLSTGAAVAAKERMLTT